MYPGLSNKRGGARNNVQDEINMEDKSLNKFFDIYYVKKV
jgi:hypothetical protein